MAAWAARALRVRNLSGVHEVAQLWFPQNQQAAKIAGWGAHTGSGSRDCLGQRAVVVDCQC
jgi:hypothetical protein